MRILTSDLPAALHNACMNPGRFPAEEWDGKALATVRALLSAGADPHSTVACPDELQRTPGLEAMYTTLNGKTPLEMAEGGGLAMTARALREAGAGADGIGLNSG